MNTALILPLLSFFVVTSAQGRTIAANYHRPLLRAELTETDALGHEHQTLLYQKKELTLESGPNSLEPVSFLFSEDSGLPPCKSDLCPMMPQSREETRFFIRKIQKDHCGSIRYIAFAPARKNVSSERLYVIDHENRYCRDYKKHRWEVLHMSKRSVRYFFGDPQQVRDPQQCQKDLLARACIMIYAPAT